MTTVAPAQSLPPSTAQALSGPVTATLLSSQADLETLAPGTLLRTFVADTGIAVETNRLHRRRPVRDADRTYLIFEAFEVEANEPLRFSLRALPPRAASRRPALLLALLPVAIGAAGVADQATAINTVQAARAMQALIRRVTEGIVLPPIATISGSRLQTASCDILNIYRL